MRETLIDNENYNLSVEWNGDQPFLHCEVHKWSHSIARTFSREVSALHAKHNNRPIYAIVPIDDHLLHKFMTKLGFEHMATRWSLDEYGNDKVIDIWTSERTHANSFAATSKHNRRVSGSTR